MKRFLALIVMFAVMESTVLAQGHKIGKGWSPGEYYFIGQDSGDGHLDYSIYRTEDFGEHIERINTETFYWVLTDARAGCVYGVGEGHGRASVVSWDSCRTWEEVDYSFFRTGYGPTTGRRPGELYIPYQDSIRYSLNHGESYTAHLSENMRYDLLVGHQDGEVYSYAGGGLYRSEDYGRHFSLVYDSFGNDSIGFNDMVQLRTGPADGELYLLDLIYFRIFRSDDHGRSFVMQRDLLRDDYTDHREWWIDIATGQEAGDFVIYGCASNFWLGGTIRFLVSHDYGRNFEVFTPFDYPSYVGKSETILPGDLEIAAFPNPFNGRTGLAITLPLPQVISLKIIDLKGRLIDHPAQGFYPAGTHRLLWPRPDTQLTLFSGCYFAILNGQNYVSICKLVIIK